MRWDRALSVYLVHPAQRAMTTGRPRGLPILMYHSIAESERGRLAYYNVNTSATVFEKQMRYLQEHGYRTILVSEAVQLLSKHQWPEAPTVVISFDDGYRNFYTHAFAILQEYGFTATMFLPTNYIRSVGTSFQGVESMTWNEVR
ncbi:MAG: polysaccharide deacetylase family protein, partial [Limisphaerales bacterium]